MTPERWIERGLLVAMVVLLPLVAGLYTQLPPSIDQWQLDYTGWMITRGQAPYVDLRDGNWPMSHWLHALSVTLWGTDVEGWRRTDLGILLLATAAGAPLAARLAGRAAVGWWILLHPLLYVTSGAWFAGQRDVVAGHLGLVALAMAWRALESKRLGSALLSGVMLTTAALVKPTFALFAAVVPLLAWQLARAGEIDARAAIRRVAGIASWSIGALLLAVLVLALSGSTVEAFWEHAILGIVSRVPADSVPVSESLLGVVERVARSWHWVFGGAVVATLAAHRGSDVQARIAAGLAWSVVAIGVVSHVVQGHNFAYYLGPLLVGLSLLVSGGLGWATRQLSEPGPLRVVALALIALAVLGSLSKVRTAYGELFPVAFGDRDRAVWEARFGAGDGISLAEARSVAADLAAMVPPEGTLLVWGRANVLNLLAERPQPTGFYHPPHFQREFLSAELLTAWESEFIDDLRGSPPAAAWVRDVHAFGVTRSSRFLESWLAEHYRPGRALGDGRIHRRVSEDRGE